MQYYDYKIHIKGQHKYILDDEVNIIACNCYSDWWQLL